MRTRLLPILILLVSLFSCSSSSNTGGGGSPLIYDFRPGRANINPGTSTLLLANFVGGTATIDQGIGPVLSGVPITVSPSKSTVYTLTVKGASGDPATATTTVSVGPMSVSINPPWTSLAVGQSQTFTAATIGLADTRLTWSAEGGTIDSKGVFVAGNLPGSYLIGAQSVAEPTLCAKAFVTVLASPITIAISINPPTAIVTTGRTITLTAQISGTSNNAVTWATTGGTITTTGEFTAPNATGPVTVTATSLADPSKSASTTFNIVAAPVASSLTATKGTTTAGTSTFLTPSFANGTATIGTTGPGSSDLAASASNGVAIATGPLAATTTYTLTVTNPAGDAATTTRTITVVAAPTASLAASSAAPLFGATNVTVTPSFTGGTAVLGTTQGASDLSINATSGTPITVQGTGFASATSYWLRVTNPAGDFVDASTTITPQTVTVGAITPAAPIRTVSTPTAFSTTVTGGALGTVTWSSSGGTWLGNAWTAPATAGSYTITATSIDNPAKSASTSVNVIPAPTVPVITAPANTTTLVAGYAASVPAQAGSTYAWSITGGTIVGSTTGTSITFTAGAVGTLTLNCTVTNAAGTPSAPGTASVNVIVAPTVPVITAPANATTLVTGYAASIPAQTGSTYAWSITGGTIVGSTTGTSITFTAGAVGTLTLNCTVTNAAGTPSAPGTASVNVVAAPAISLFTLVDIGSASSNWVLNATYMGISGTVADELGNPIGSIASGGQISLGLTHADLYTLTVANAAGDSVTKTASAVVLTVDSGLTASLLPGQTLTPAAHITGATNTTILYSAASGSINAGVFTPPMAVGAYTLTLTAQADPSVFANIVVNVIPLVMPRNQVVAPGASFIFRAPMLGISNTAVKWSVTPSTLGTIDPNTGVFTADAVNTGLATITAASAADPTVTGTANVTVQPGFAYANTFTPVTVSGITTLRTQHALTRLSFDYVLASGGLNAGSPTAILELWNGTTWVTSAVALTTARSRHTATLLPNGKVLIAGGRDASNTPVASAEIYDYNLGTMDTPPGPMTSARADHTATLMQDGRVLIAGGQGATGPLASAEIYDPVTNSFAAVATPMTAARVGHSAVALLDGRVLVAGGSTDGTDVALSNTADLFDPASGSFTPATGLMISGRRNMGAALAPDGSVTLLGGVISSGTPSVYAGGQQFDPGTSSFLPIVTPMSTARNRPLFTVLANGNMLALGGSSDLGSPADQNGTLITGTFDQFNPITQTYPPATYGFNIPIGGGVDQLGGRCILLADGSVLLVGNGLIGTGPTVGSVIYQ